MADIQDRNFDNLLARFETRIYASVKGGWQLKHVLEDSYLGKDNKVTPPNLHSPHGERTAMKLNHLRWNSTIIVCPHPRYRKICSAFTTAKPIELINDGGQY